MTPLNGTKTHPLSDHAKEELRNLCREAMPAQQINPGVINRLLREDLIRFEDRPSPYEKDKRKVRMIPFAVITDAGRLAATQGEK